MRENREYIVTEEFHAKRVDKFLSEIVAEFSREKLKQVFDEHLVLIGGKPVKPSEKVLKGDIVRITLPETSALAVEAQNIPLNIVYEDEDIAVVDKPQGMVVHPAPGNYTNTMVNGLLFHIKNLSAINGVIRPGIVHRIDKDTSGLLVVAKNDAAHHQLAQQFDAHTITRAYTAVVHGVIANDKGIVDAPIGRDPSNRKAMAVTERNNKRAVTHYQTVKRYEHVTHINLQLETGRTHQIRVHMKYIRHPVVGDRQYGYDMPLDKLFEGQLLHACLLGFIHPRTHQYMEFYSEIPQYFYKIIDKNL